MEYVTWLRALVRTFADLVACRNVCSAVDTTKSVSPFLLILLYLPSYFVSAILAGMILFKGFTTPAKGEHAKSIMSVVMRECVNPSPLFPHFLTNLILVAVQSSTSQSSSPS
jgi:hypothetical protein